MFQLLWFPPRVVVVSEGVVGLDGACGDVFLSGPRWQKAYFSSTALAAPAWLLKRPSVLMCQTFSRFWNVRQMSRRAAEILHPTASMFKNHCNSNVKKKRRHYRWVNTAWSRLSTKLFLKSAEFHVSTFPSARFDSIYSRFRFGHQQCFFHSSLASIVSHDTLLIVFHHGRSPASAAYSSSAIWILHKSAFTCPWRWTLAAQFRDNGGRRASPLIRSCYLMPLRSRHWFWERSSMKWSQRQVTVATCGGRRGREFIQRFLLNWRSTGDTSRKLERWEWWTGHNCSQRTRLWDETIFWRQRKGSISRSVRFNDFGHDRMKIFGDPGECSHSLTWCMTQISIWRVWVMILVKQGGRGAVNEGANRVTCMFAIRSVYLILLRQHLVKLITNLRKLSLLMLHPPKEDDVSQVFPKTLFVLFVF